MKYLLLAVLLLLSLGQVAAQGKLAETYTNEAITFQYPTAWVVEVEEQFIYLKNEAAIDNNATEMTTGQFMMGFATAELLEQNGLTVTSTEELIQTLISFIEEDDGTASAPVSLEINGHPATRFDTSGGKTADQGAVAIEFTEGIVLVAYQVAPGEMAQFNPTFLAILDTLTYENPLALRQWASDATATTEFGSDSWSAAQATGEPNTTECGDFGTAWASSSSTGEDALTVSFDQVVQPTQVNIYQTYNPGSIVRVELKNSESGKVYEIPASADPVGNTECPGVLTLDTPDIKAVFNQVVIYVDQTIGGSWNEIDAVELVGIPAGADIRQWANSATATTEFGSSSWNAEQATGEPNTTLCGDFGTAWASSSSTGQDTLTVGFDVPVIPSQINIHQTYTPGSIIQVDLITASGETIQLPKSADPVGNTDCPGVFTLDITDITEPINAVAIHLDQTIGGNWNEIDAVELVGSLSQ